MSDEERAKRLEEIRVRNRDRYPPQWLDVDWFIAELERLQDHPPGIGDGDIQRLFRERDAWAAYARRLKVALEACVFWLQQVAKTQGIGFACLEPALEALAETEPTP